MEFPKCLLIPNWLLHSLGGSKKSKAKDSDDEESDDDCPEDEKNEEADQSESDDSTSKKSSVAGKDFELVDKNDTDAWTTKKIQFKDLEVVNHPYW